MKSTMHLELHSAALPAAETLAEVVRLRSGREVHLPPQFARAAVEAWLKLYKAAGDVIEGPSGPEATGRALSANEWAIRLTSYRWDPKLHARDVRRHGDQLVYIFAKHTVALAAAPAGYLLRALEQVKPEEFDAEGRPLPWVPVRHETQALGGASGRDDDAVVLSSDAELPPTHDETADAEIQDRFDKLSRSAGVAPALTLTRGRVNKLGFTTGRVWYGQDGVPRRVHLTTCPNSDVAEVLATIVHELAHPLSGKRDHGDAFKVAMVGLAERHWGPEWFVEARQRLAERYHILDYWLAAGIRCALRDSAPPVARNGDDGHMARVVTKIRKLRELAADQLGRPEGISATAMANDLITTYGLGDYTVHIDAGIEAQLVDRWVPIRDGVWRRVLAHGIAKATDVFALALPRTSRMHFFGRYADVLEAEYVFFISEARIDRECERHLEAWKANRSQVRRGDVIRERVSFCDSAVLAFCKKLDQIVIEEEAAVSGRRGGTPTEPLAAAEEFARVQHERRGSGWTSGGRRTTRHNASGSKVGQALEIVRGLDSAGEAPKALMVRG